MGQFTRYPWWPLLISVFPIIVGDDSPLLMLNIDTARHMIMHYVPGKASTTLFLSSLVRLGMGWRVGIPLVRYPSATSIDGGSIQHGHDMCLLKGNQGNHEFPRVHHGQPKGKLILCLPLVNRLAMEHPPFPRWPAENAGFPDQAHLQGGINHHGQTITIIESWLSTILPSLINHYQRPQR